MTPYINPLGFIHRQTPKGIRFLLTDPGDSRNLQIGTPVTITQPSSDGRSLAKIRGEIASVGYVTATFTIADTLLDEGWPQNEETIREKTPVYLAKENSFEPDLSRMLTAEQAERIREIARKYTDVCAVAARERSSNHKLASGRCCASISGSKLNGEDACGKVKVPQKSAALHRRGACQRH